MNVDALFDLISYIQLADEEYSKDLDTNDAFGYGFLFVIRYLKDEYWRIGTNLVKDEIYTFCKSDLLGHLKKVEKMTKKLHEESDHLLWDDYNFGELYGIGFIEGMINAM